MKCMTKADAMKRLGLEYQTDPHGNAATLAALFATQAGAKPPKTDAMPRRRNDQRSRAEVIHDEQLAQLAGLRHG